MFVNGCGYTITLDGQKSWWGATGSGGRTAKCAANEDGTWLWTLQYHLSNIFLGSCWNNEYCIGFFLARARKKRIPISRWSLRMTGCQPTYVDLAIRAPYVPNLCFPPRHHWKGFKLSESDTKGRHLESGNLKMYTRHEGKAPAIPLAEVGNNNCSAWSSAQKYDFVTAASCAKGYHFMQTYLPKCLNGEVLRDIHLTDWNLGQICLNFYCLIENRFLYFKCKEHSIDCTSVINVCLQYPS